MKRLIYILSVCGMLWDATCVMPLRESGTPPLQEKEHRRVTPPRRIMNPTYDTTFKELFGGETQESKERTKHLLNSILDLGIVEIEFLPTEKKENYQKHIIYDVLCRCRCRCEKEGRNYTIDIEIQRNRQHFYFDRTYYYGAQALVSNAESAQSYDEISRTIVLSFLDHELPDDLEPVFCGRLMKTPVSLEGVRALEAPKVLSDMLEFWYVQLPRVGAVIHEQSSVSGISDDGMRWLRILSSKYLVDGSRDDDIPLYGTEEYEQIYQTTLDRLESYRNKDLYEKFRIEQMRIDRDRKNYVSQLAEDIEHARNEGLAEGEIKGRLKAIIRYYFSKFKQEYDEHQGKVSLALGRKLKDIDIKTVEKALENQSKGNRPIDKEKIALFIAYVEAAKERGEQAYTKEPSFLLDE